MGQERGHTGHWSMNLSANLADDVDASRISAFESCASPFHPILVPQSSNLVKWLEYKAQFHPRPYTGLKEHLHKPAVDYVDPAVHNSPIDNPSYQNR